MGVKETEYGCESEKDLNAGLKELHILLTQPKMLSSSYYITLECTDTTIRFTDSMKSVKYNLELIGDPHTFPITYTFEMDMGGSYTKKSDMRVFLEPVDNIKTRMRIEARSTDFQFGAVMAQTAHYMDQTTLEGMKSVMMDLTVFQGLIDNAVHSNIPYIRDTYIVKGDYIGAKIDIKDSVLQRTDIKVDGRNPMHHVRADTHVPHDIDIKDSVVTRSKLGSGEGGKASIDGSVVTRSDLTGGQNVKDDVMVGRQAPKGKVEGAAECLGDPNLEAYRKALEQAMADGVIVETENNMLNVLRTQLGITMEQHESLLAEIRKSGDVNIETYRKLMVEAYRDGVIDNDEANMLEIMRQSLGISPAKHGHLLQEIKREKSG